MKKYIIGRVLFVIPIMFVLSLFTFGLTYLSPSDPVTLYYQSMGTKPDKKMVESKSLKFYLVSFRNHGDFHEDVVNIIMKDLIKLLDPKYIEVWGKFLPRGGISIDPYANYGRPGTKYEELAWKRFSEHDMAGMDRVDNR